MRRTDVRAVSHSPLPRCFWRTVVECKFDELKTVARTLIRDIYCAKLETIFLYVWICIVIAANLAIWLFKWAQSKQLTELSFNEICVCIDGIILGGHRSIAIRGRHQNPHFATITCKMLATMALPSRSPQSTECALYARTLVAFVLCCFSRTT